MTPLLEVCVESAAGVQAAQEAGADRIELCAALSEGGLTPSLGLIRAARRVAQIPVHVMIRPRPGDFVYSEAEFAVMREDLSLAVEAGADGVVLGILQPNHAVDEQRLAVLTEMAAGRAVTFHRAFDFVPDLDDAWNAIARCGVTRILTSGGAATALEGIATLHALAHRPGIEIIGAGGIRAGNVAEILRRTGLREIHFAPRRTVRTHSIETTSPQISGLSEPRFETDLDAIRALRAVLDAR